jgi:hypothetical protein
MPTNQCGGFHLIRPKIEEAIRDSPRPQKANTFQIVPPAPMNSCFMGGIREGRSNLSAIRNQSLFPAPTRIETVLDEDFRLGRDAPQSG